MIVSCRSLVSMDFVPCCTPCSRSAKSHCNWRGFENFQVKSGRWEFSGVTTQSFNVLNGGTMAGNGTFDAITIFSGGILAPGTIDLMGNAHIGTITATGDVLFQNGSTYQPQISPTGTSDLFHIAGFGALSINAGAKLNVVALPGGVAASTGLYRIVTADNNITGTFSSVTDNVPDINFTPIYTAKSIDLQVVKSPTSVSPKTILVAGLGSGVESSLLFNRTMRRQANASMSAATNVKASRLSANAYAETEQSARTDAFAALQDEKRGRLWTAPIGQYVNVNNSNGSLGYDSATGGFAIGLERYFTGAASDYLLGISGGVSWTNARGQRSRADLFSGHVGAFGSANLGALDIAASLSGDVNSYNFQRAIGLNGGGAMFAGSHTSGYSFSFGTEATYNLLEGRGLTLASGGDASGDIDIVSFGPMVGFEYGYSQSNAFTETGAGLLNLNVGSQNNRHALLQVGADIKAKTKVNGTDVVLDGRLALEHELQNNSNQMSTSLAALPTFTYNAGAAPLGRNRLLVGLGATFKKSERLSATVRYDARLFGANASSSHQFSAGLKLRF